MAKLLSMHHVDRWLPVSIVPRGLPVEVSVIDDSGFHALVVACRWNGEAWAGVSTSKPLDIKPSHWRPWSEDRSRQNLGISRVWIRYGFRSGRS